MMLRLIDDLRAEVNGLDDPTLWESLVVHAQPLQAPLADALAARADHLPESWLAHVPATSSETTLLLATQLLQQYAPDQVAKSFPLLPTVQRTEHGEVVVPGSNPDKPYRVGVGACKRHNALFGCACQDWLWQTNKAQGCPGYLCKHLRAVWALAIAEVALAAALSALWHAERVVFELHDGVVTIDPASGVRIEDACLLAA